MPDLKVAIIQSDISWEDKAHNYAHFSEQIKTIALDTDVIILPEMFNVGFSSNIEKAFTPADEIVKWMHIQAQSSNACIVAGVMTRNDQGKLVNRLYWVQPDGVVHHYDKVHLFVLSKEAELVTAGKQRQVIEYQGCRCLLTICFDLRFPVFHSKHNDYDAIINIASWPSTRAQHWRTLLQAKAIENQAYVLGCNRIGHDGSGLSYRGDSMAVDYNGEIVSELAPNQAGVIYATLDMNGLKHHRERFPFLDSQD